MAARTGAWVRANEGLSRGDRWRLRVVVLCAILGLVAVPLAVLAGPGGTWPDVEGHLLAWWLSTEPRLDADLSAIAFRDGKHEAGDMAGFRAAAESVPGWDVIVLMPPYSQVVEVPRGSRLQGRLAAAYLKDLGNCVNGSTWRLEAFRDGRLVASRYGRLSWDIPAPTDGPSGAVFIER